MPRRQTSNFVHGISLQRSKVPSLADYPFSIPAIGNLHELDFDQPVTFLIGENGSGKSTLFYILGGLTSIPGAIVGGLIIGVGEKIGEFYWGPLVGSGIESWLAYIIALAFLLFRPQGLFGERIIERI